MTGDSNDDYEPYNGAAHGCSPYDLDISECRYTECDDGNYDPCDDAEDYGEEDIDDED